MPSYTLRTGFIPVISAILCLAALACGGTQQEDSKNVTLLAHVNQYASTKYNDVWGYTAPDGREYALLGVRNGTSIIDITDTDNPVEIVFIASTLSTGKVILHPGKMA